jgi:hypothetical protein
VVEGFIVHMILGDIPVPGPTRTIPPRQPGEGPTRCQKNEIVRKQGGQAKKIGFVCPSPMKEDEEGAPFARSLR